MAQQESIIKLKGRIGDLTFYKTRTGYQARAKGGVSAERIATDPNYQRTRENGMEFGLAVRKAKRMRDVLRTLTLQYSDSRMPNRLSSRMLRVIKADEINDRGERQVLGVNTPMLKNFQFNIKSSIDNTLYVDVTHSIDRSTGIVNVNLPAFDAGVAVSSPQGTTHFQLKAAAVIVDFEGNESESIIEESEMLDVKAKSESMEFNMELSEASTHPIFLILGIGFFQEVNEKHYPLQNGTFNALTIIDVDGE